MSLRVIQPGLLSLPVDLGRPSFRSLGVPLGGAADRASCRLANALVGNPPDAVALELTLAGPTLVADHEVGCVVFGAPFQLSIDGRNEQPEVGLTFALQEGETLRIGGTPTGARGYLAVVRGFEHPKVLGSASAFRGIRSGDALSCESSRISGRTLPFSQLSGGDGTTFLRVVIGPQRDWFFDDAFFTNEYFVAAASNRMGLRLEGPKLIKRDAELTSEPVAPGAVQVANDGLPIVLGIDGQTIGGYPKIAHVIGADLDRLARLRPASRVRFHLVSIQEAEDEADANEAFLRNWEMRLGASR